MEGQQEDILEPLRYDSCGKGPEGLAQQRYLHTRVRKRALHTRLTTSSKGILERENQLLWLKARITRRRINCCKIKLERAMKSESRVYRLRIMKEKCRSITINIWILSMKEDYQERKRKLKSKMNIKDVYGLQEIMN